MSFAAYTNAKTHTSTPTSLRKDNDLGKPRSRQYKAHTYKRIAQSCSNCRERRVKCDRVKPCSSCCSKGIHENCVFLLHPKDHKPVRQSFEIRRLRLEVESLKAQLKMDESLTATPMKASLEFTGSVQILPSPTAKVTEASEQRQSLLAYKFSPTDPFSAKSTKTLEPKKKSTTIVSSQSKQRVIKISKKLELSKSGKATFSELFVSKNPQSNDKNGQLEGSPRLSSQTLQATNIIMDPESKPALPTQIALEGISRCGNSVRIIKNASSQKCIGTETSELPWRWTEFKVKPELNETPTMSPKNTACVGIAGNAASFDEGGAIQGDIISSDHNPFTSHCGLGSLGSFNGTDSFSSNDSFSSLEYLPLPTDIPELPAIQYASAHGNMSIGYMMVPAVDSSSTMTEVEYYQLPCFQSPHADSNSGFYHFGEYKDPQQEHTPTFMLSDWELGIPYQ